MSELSVYPTQAAQRDRWVLERRPPRHNVNPLRPHSFLVEQEHTRDGDLVPVATVFLTSRECPWRCAMCDLWKNTFTHPTPPGAIPEQIRFALASMPRARHVKLYNSGSFFDRQAVPPEDYAAIAMLIDNHERVIVESHPSLVGDLVLQFRDLLRGQLEVAMGLETVHPEALEKINKKLTLDQFAAAAKRLKEARVDLRVFILVQPPFVLPREALVWAERSIDFAFDCGATVVTLIPTRAENGAMEEFAANGEFTPPKLSILESALAYGLDLQRGRVFIDLWDIANVQSCPECREIRIERLRLINLSQSLLPPVPCLRCGGLS